MLVVGDYEHSGIHHLLIRQPQGGIYSSPRSGCSLRQRAFSQLSSFHDFPSQELDEIERIVGQLILLRGLVDRLLACPSENRYPGGIGALGGTLGIPPAPPVMIDDDHFALVPAVFQGAACAALAVQLPGRCRPLQQDGAAYLLPELIQPFSPFAAGSVSARLANDGAPGAVSSSAEAGYGLELVAAAPEMLPVGLVEDSCPVRELVQVEVAAVVQLEEDRPVSRQRNVP